MLAKFTSRFIIFLAICMLSILMQAQVALPEHNQHALDSLTQILVQSNLHDTARIRAYVMLTELVYTNRFPDSTWKYANQAIDRINEALENATDDQVIFSLYRSKGLALNNKALVLRIKGNEAEASKLFHEAIYLYRLANFDFRLRETFENLSDQKEDLGNVDSALYYLYQAIPINQELEIEHRLVYCYYRLGYCYGKQGAIDSAMANYQKAMNASDNLNQKLSCILALVSTPDMPENVLKSVGDTINEYARDEQTSLSVARIYNRLGQYFRYKADYAYALRCYQNSQDLRIQNGNNDFREYVNIGHLYNSIGDEQSAVEYYAKALIFGQDTFPKSSPNRLNALAWPKIHLGRRLLYTQPDSGLALMQTAIQHWKDAGPRYRERGAIEYGYKEIAYYYLRQKNYDRALRISDTMKYWQSQEPTKTAVIASVRANAYYHMNILDSALKYATLWKDMSIAGSASGFKQTSSQSAAKQLLARIYKKRGEFELAYRYQKSSDSLQSIIDDNDNKGAIAVHREQKRLQQQRLESDEKIKQERNRKILFASGGLLFLILAGGLFSRLRYVRKTKAIIEKEKNRSESLLLNILPAEIAEELKEKGKSEARDYDNVSVLFTDFVAFTETAERLSAKELVDEINQCFEAFDKIITKYKLEKIKTIGDAYMAAGGLHTPRISEPNDVVSAAVEMQSFMLRRKEERTISGLAAFDMRVGIHTGPVVAGIVGVKKFQYDIWGDTVNTASRMESYGEIGKVNISNATYELIEEDSQYAFESRGKVDVKGKGEMEMWFVKRKESQYEHTKP